MIDGNTCVSCAEALQLNCEQIGEIGTSFENRIVVKEKIKRALGIKGGSVTTEEIGNFLVNNLNTDMYNNVVFGLINGGSSKQNIPSLVITTTTDMWSGGYDGKTEEDNEPSEKWEKQIDDTEYLVKRNPLRLFSLYSYDPRRYKGMNEGNRAWKKPFEKIIGRNEQSNMWLGFCMKPQLGFRPFDEHCTYLTNFYTECVKTDVPILACCAPCEIREERAGSYRENGLGKSEETRWAKSKTRHNNGKRVDKEILYSKNYRGTEDVVNGKPNMNYFNLNFGHPRNWVPALEYCRGIKKDNNDKSGYDLRLCLGGFGGNAEWGHDSMTMWGKKDLDSLPREWIRCIIKLTAKYKNVYADISGLNINNEVVCAGLDKMLRLIQEKNDDFKHLKYKLIFGSGWYLNENNYERYCKSIMDLFYSVDCSGELWEYVSLFNPWRFYALDKNIKKIYDNLISAKSKNVAVNSGMLEYMGKEMFDDKTGLVNHIKRTDMVEQSKNSDASDEGIGDLDPLNLCSIFKKFSDEPEKDEQFYCFRKFHVNSTPICGTDVVGCKQWIGKKNVDCYCAHKRERFSTLVEDLIEITGQIMDEENEIDGKKDITVCVEEMKRQVMNSLHVIRLYKGDSEKETHGALLLETGKAAIEINIKREKNTGKETYIDAADVGSLLKALNGKPNGWDMMVEHKIGAVLIHELRHVWQRVQPNGSDTRKWFETESGENGGKDKVIDIMAEVDAFDIQSKYEGKYLEEKKNEYSNTTVIFRKYEKDMEKKIREKSVTVDERVRLRAELMKQKAEFLWKDYGYALITMNGNKQKELYRCTTCTKISD